MGPSTKTFPCRPLRESLGVCSDSRPRCVGGEWLACEASSYGANFEPDETRCDGLDNDCDGQIEGIEGTDGFWVVNERGTQRRSFTPGLQSVRITPSHDTFAAFAWEHEGTVWAVRRCAP